MIGIFHSIIYQKIDASQIRATQVNLSIKSKRQKTTKKQQNYHQPIHDYLCYICKTQHLFVTAIIDKLGAKTPKTDVRKLV